MAGGDFFRTFVGLGCLVVGVGFGLSVNDIKYSAQPVAAALCYANKEYQNDRGQCEIKWYVSDKNYHDLSYLKYPVRIEVIKDGVDKEGFRHYFYLVKKDGKEEGWGIVKIRKPIPKNGLYIRANKGLDYWVTVEYENDKEVKVGYRAHYAYTDRTYWGEVDTFTVPTCSDAYADCRAPNVMLVQAADNILYCPPLRKEFIERGYEMPYSEIMSKLSKYVREGKCYYRACVPGGGGTFCAAQGTDAMDVATCMATGCNY